MLATAVGPNLTKHLHDQLELMFQCGLSEPLRQALVSIAKHIPPLLKSIQGEYPSSYGYSHLSFGVE
jgi:FKBP12-rapamycin complex-associated protein